MWNSVDDCDDHRGKKLHYDCFSEGLLEQNGGDSTTALNRKNSIKKLARIKGSGPVISKEVSICIL